ncbi:FecR family protein [Sunxiuqinia sp. A32]|uniref:FecR family protein n=1 Tax=Sunxiuqinia sp. A32 TaxID=3461496 RepID=UPI004046333B
MSKNEIWKNISRHLAGEGDQNQEIELNEWKSSDNRNQKVFIGISEVWNHKPQYTSENQKIYDKFQHRVNRYKRSLKNRGLLYYAFRIAAVLILALSISVVVRSYLSVKNNSELVYQEISVPKGNRSSLVLPDGTKVWVSNNSTIKYPSLFSKDAREIYLTGEAYFEVTHNEKKPFVVNIGENRIKVLGTKFSVSAYPEDTEVKTELLSGKIQFDVFDSSVNNFKSFVVKAGQSLAFNKKTRIVSESEIKDDFYDYWQKGIYTFKNESLESLAAKIQRIYNVEVVFEQDYLRTKRYSGSFSVNDNIFTFIEAIKQTSVEPLNYNFSGNKLYLYR